jgi:glucosamine-6-phosphate deaminase
MQRYIQERIVERTGIVHAFVLDGSRPKTWTRAAAAVRQAPVNVTFAGIGENGHLAFNEPPADFMTEEPFIVVNLLNKAG